MTHTSRLNADELYALVPAVHRQRDAARGEPLRALLAVLAEQGALVEDDIAALYENWFIETCDEWVVPYVAGQVAVRGLREIGEGVPFSRRALVANTIGYRRRKGTASVLEQLAFDTTGWRAVAVEFFQRLGWTQHVNHVRPGAGGTAHLRPADAAAHAGGPFDAHARTADVRSIAAGRGRHNVSHLGLFLWRLQAYRVLRGELRPSGEAPVSSTAACRLGASPLAETTEARPEVPTEFFCTVGTQCAPPLWWSLIAAAAEDDPPAADVKLPPPLPPPAALPPAA